MKNRKNVLIVFAVLAILCLGIGYAALTDSLTFGGTIEADGSASTSEDENLFDIQYVAGTLNATPTHAVAGKSYITAEGVIDDVNYNVSYHVENLATVGDKANFTVDVQNVKCESGFAGKIKYEITNNIATTYPEYFKVTVAWEEITGNDVTISGDEVTLVEGQVVRLSVTIELIKTVPGADKTINGGLNITLNATEVVAA